PRSLAWQRRGGGSKIRVHKRPEHQDPPASREHRDAALPHRVLLQRVEAVSSDGPSPMKRPLQTLRNHDHRRYCALAPVTVYTTGRAWGRVNQLYPCWRLPCITRSIWSIFNHSL